MGLLVRRPAVALLSSAALLALCLATAPASALDTGDCEDGSCPTGTLPTEGPAVLDTAADYESETESEGPGSMDDVGEAGEPDSGSEGR